MARFVTYDIKLEGFAILNIQKEPVNSMDLELWCQLSDAFEDLERNENVKGVIITSGLKRDIFTAGNDITALYAPMTSEEAYSKFWLKQNRFLMKLLLSRLITVAAIRGACPAAGCIIGLCSDYRIMTQNGSIGLNEVALGIPVPKYWGLLMAEKIGNGPTEKLLLLGRLLSTQEAFKRGLVDQVVTQDNLLDEAVKYMKQALVMPQLAYHQTKLNLREPLVLAWQEYLPLEVKSAWAGLTSKPVVDKLQAVLQGLSKKKNSNL